MDYKFSIHFRLPGCTLLFNIPLFIIHRYRF